MLLANGKLGTAQMLKPETVALMNQNSMGDLNVTLLKTAQPDLPTMPSSSPAWSRNGAWPT